ncbi:DUF4268 domain-containing protein [Candidatus Poribacteria bacterium]|nr:MAG: DUF4268 domain-containing protein [Candidatus Poribacteria bacterium]
MSNELSRLKEVCLRKIWETEPQHFTPWLAQEENLSLLSETLGMELELEGQEIRVGDYRADLLCINEDNSRVLIENQLEDTDHRHLGQVITYFAGLDVNTIIWIAKKFKDEHRAAIDKLNEITEESYRYFGIEIKVWQIGDSLKAPQFDVVCSPNNWSRNVIRDSKQEIAKNLSDTQKLQEQFWTEFKNYLTIVGSELKMPQPRPQARIVFSIGKADISIYSIINIRERKLRIQLTLLGKNSNLYFHLLMKDKNEIDDEIGENLEWSERPGNKECQVYLVKYNTDITNKESWEQTHSWLHQKLELFYTVFHHRIIELDATDWNSEDYGEEENHS